MKFSPIIIKLMYVLLYKRHHGIPNIYDILLHCCVFAWGPPIGAHHQNTEGKVGLKGCLFDVGLLRAPGLLIYK